MKYRLYFEFYGHHFTTTVEASNPSMAKEQVKNRIMFHTVEEENPLDNYDSHFVGGNDKDVDNLASMLGINNFKRYK